MVETAKPEWMKMSAKEVEKIIIDLAKEGNSSDKIGLILRDKHGIPKAKLVGKRISEVMKNVGIENKTLKKVQQDRISSLEAHIKAHKHDNSAKKSLSKRMWVVHKLSK